MLEYLQNFAAKFNLHKYIHFHTNVELVEPVKKESESEVVDQCESEGVCDTVRWRVHTRDLELGTVTREIYDIVLVCNGLVYD